MTQWAPDTGLWQADPCSDPRLCSRGGFMVLVFLRVPVDGSEMLQMGFNLQEFQ